MFLLQSTSTDYPVAISVPARHVESHFSGDHTGSFEAELKRAIESSDHPGDRMRLPETDTVMDSDRKRAPANSDGNDDSAKSVTARNGDARENDERVTKQVGDKRRESRLVRKGDERAESAVVRDVADAPAESKGTYPKGFRGRDAAIITRGARDDVSKVVSGARAGTTIDRSLVAEDTGGSRKDGETTDIDRKGRGGGGVEGAHSPKSTELASGRTTESTITKARASDSIDFDGVMPAGESRIVGGDATVARPGSRGAAGVGDEGASLKDAHPRKPGEAGASVKRSGTPTVTLFESGKFSAETERAVPNDRIDGENRRRIDAKSAVVDLRSAGRDATAQRHDSAVANAAYEAETVEVESGEPVIVHETRHTERGNGVTLEVRTGGSGAAANRLFGQTMTDEIVRQSTILLKSENRGEIRMVLKPEQLGNLRIRLEIDHNRITGRFVVDNAAIKEAVEQNLESLARAFREQGYDSATLDVTVGGRKEGSDGSGGERKAVLDRRAVRELEESTPAVKSEYDTTINLVV